MANSGRSLAPVDNYYYFVLLAVANALTGLAVFAVVVNLVPMLVEQGMSRNVAALALGLGGVGQVAFFAGQDDGVNALVAAAVTDGVFDGVRVLPLHNPFNSADRPCGPPRGHRVPSGASTSARA